MKLKLHPQKLLTLFVLLFLSGFIISKAQPKSVMVFSPEIQNMQEILFAINSNSVVNIISDLNSSDLSELLAANPEIEDMHIFIKGDEASFYIDSKTYEYNSKEVVSFLANLKQIIVESGIKKIYIYTPGFALNSLNQIFLREIVSESAVNVHAISSTVVKPNELIFDYSIIDGKKQSVESVLNGKDISINLNELK